jgi:hypothetical protein
MRLLEQIATHQRLYSLLMREKETHSLASWMRLVICAKVERKLPTAV